MAGARLISSTSTMSANTGPRWKSKSPLFMLNTVVPSTSLGIRSGVNWILPNCVSMSLLIVRAISVFATPGTPSSRIWPLARIEDRIKSMVNCWPTTTFDIHSFISRAFSANPLMSGLSIVLCGYMVMRLLQNVVDFIHLVNYFHHKFFGSGRQLGRHLLLDDLLGPVFCAFVLQDAGSNLFFFCLPPAEIGS